MKYKVDDKTCPAPFTGLVRLVKCPPFNTIMHQAGARLHKESI